MSTDLDNSVEKHRDWKSTFRRAILEQRQLDVATIEKDNCCDLGKWLHGAGRSKFGGLTNFSECVEKHTAFHIEAGKVALAINAKRYDEASVMLARFSAYSQTSGELVSAIELLKIAAGI
jgi:methyl-accepting chemotaxis protein